jgi:hypothetical protein
MQRPEYASMPKETRQTATHAEQENSTQQENGASSNGHMRPTGAVRRLCVNSNETRPANKQRVQQKEYGAPNKRNMARPREGIWRAREKEYGAPERRNMARPREGI